MEANLWALVNFEQNDWAKFLLIAEFVYYNTKNTSTSHMPFKLHYDYYSQMSYKENINFRSKLNLADKLLVELRELIIVYWENLYHAQKFQKQAHNKGVKP